MRAIRSCSVRRYRIEGGTLPDPGSAAFLKRLKDRRFLPLKAHEERTYGWVSADNLLVTEFDAESVVHRLSGGGIAGGGTRAILSCRIDRRRVSARLLRAHVDLETRARAKAVGSDGRPARISREERQQLRKDLHDDLLRQTTPSVEAHALVLDPAARSVLVLTLSRPANEAIRALFRDTFDADLRALAPRRRGVEMLEGRPGAALLGTLHRTEFAPAGSDVPAALLRRSAAAAEWSAEEARS